MHVCAVSGRVHFAPPSPPVQPGVMRATFVHFAPLLIRLSAPPIFEIAMAKSMRCPDAKTGRRSVFSPCRRGVGVSKDNIIIRDTCVRFLVIRAATENSAKSRERSQEHFFRGNYLSVNLRLVNSFRPLMYA